MRRAWLLAALLPLAACGSHPSTTADRDFLSMMVPHHQQAIAAAQIAETRASDPRVRAFAQRIIAEQTPELQRMQAAAIRLTDVDTATGATTAVHRIDDAELARLRTLSGAAFDRAFVSDSITSETGAVQMAQAEVAHGTDTTVRAIAAPIAGADSPGSEIPQLQALLAALS